MLDIKTLIVLYLIANAFSAGTVAVVWVQNRRRFSGISFWLAGLVLEATGASLIVLRGMVHDLISMTLANTIIIAGLLIILIGLERFTGKKGWQVHNYILLAVFAAVSAYFAVLQPNVAVREIGMSATSLIITFQSSWLLLRRVGPGMRRITSPTGFIFALYAVTLFARIILLVTVPEPGNDFFKLGVVSSLFITTYIVLSISLAISMVLMVNWRLLADYKSQEEKFAKAFNSSPYAITITRPSDGKIFEVNGSFTDITGYRYEEIMGRNTLDLNLWVNESDRKAVVSELVRGRVVHGEEYQFRKKTGEVMTGLFSASLITSNNETFILSSIDDITARKKAEDELYVFKNLVEHSTDAIGISTPGGRHYYQNEAFSRLFGDIGDDPPETVYVDREIGKQVFQTIMDGGIWQGEVKLYGKGGKILDISQRAFAIKSPNGQVIGLGGLHTDVTGRRQAEDSLKQSEQQLRDILDSTPFPVAIVDNQDNKIEYWSRSALTLFGHTAPTASQWYELAYPDPEYRQDVVNRWKPFLERARLSGQTVNTGEYRVTCRNGTVRICELYAAFIKDKLVVTFNDITERKQAKELLTASEDKYRLLVENSHDVIYQLDMKGIFTFVSPSWKQLLGHDTNAVKGHPFQEFVHPDDVPRCEEFMAAVLDSRGILPGIEYRVRHLNGDWMWHNTNAAPVIDADGTCTSFVGVASDITDRKHLEEEQQRVSKLEAIGVLAGGIAHDFNNILTSILGNISLARIEAAPGSELSESLGQAEKASIRAKALTVKLLTFSKGGAPVKQLASLNELVRDTTSFALSGSKVKCSFDIPDDLWHAEVDPGQVSQVIHNLVINAQQAMPAGGAIELLAENIVVNERQSLSKGLPLKPGDYVRIAVVDHGGGIPPENLDKVFDPFFTTKKKGSGLGLATSFSIVQQHGGHISVESVVGSGSAFYVYLPASRETAAEQPVEKQAIQPARRARILVMDDEDGIKLIIGRMLKHLGYQDSEFASDGAEAIKLYKKALESGKPFSLAILDLTVAGGMGGEVAIRKLLEIDPGVKAIVSSGYIEDPVMAKFREYGFSGVVAKPYTVEELGKVMQDVIG